MPGVGLVRGGVLPPGARPRTAARLSPEDGYDSPAVHYRPDTGIQDVQDRSRHRVAHTFQAQKPGAVGRGAYRVAGSLTPVFPYRVVGQSADRLAPSGPEAVDSCPGASFDFLLYVDSEGAEPLAGLPSRHLE